MKQINNFQTNATKSVLSAWLKEIIFCISLVLLSFTNLFAQYEPEIVPQLDGEPIQKLILSPDGKRFISAGRKMILLWDLETGKTIRYFKAESDIYSLVFSNDGNKILAVSGGEFNIWDIYTGKNIIPEAAKKYKSRAGKDNLVIENTSRFSNGFTPNQKEFIGSSSYPENGQIFIYDTETLEKKSVFENRTGIGEVVISPDGTKIAVSDNEAALKIVSKDTWKQIKILDGEMPFVFSPDGTKIMAKSSKTPGILKIWNINTGVLSANIKSDAWSFCFSPDSKYVAIGEPLVGNLKIFESATGKLFKTINICFSNIESLIFTQDGNSIIAGDGNKDIYLVNIATGTKKTFTGKIMSLTKANFSPDGLRVVAGCFLKGLNQVKLWDVSTAALLTSYNGHQNSETPSILSVIFSPYGKNILSSSGSGEIILWDILTAKAIKSFYGHKNNVWSIAFSPDGSKIASASWEEKNNLKLWETNSGKELRNFVGHTKYVTSVSFSPDGKQIVSGGYDKILRCWDVETGNTVWSVDEKNELNRIVKVIYSPEGKKILIGNDYKGDVGYYTIAKLLQSNNGGEILKLGNSGDFSSMAFSADGRKIFTSQLGKLNILDTQSGNLLRSIPEPSKQFSISPNESTYISFNERYTSIKINSFQTGLEIVSLICFENDEWIAITPDRYFECSPNGGQYIPVVKGLDVWNIDQFAVKYNRPDIILERLGNTNTELISYLKNLYRKRLRKLNLTEDKLLTELHAPTAKITEKIQQGKFADISFALNDSKFNLKKYNIFVNNVPVYGTFGKDLNGSSFNLKEKIELTSGDNKIEVSCMNEKGTESYRALTYINYKIPVSKNLYYIGFGVSTYQNPELQLRYAHKDALDLATIFSKMQLKGFANVFTKTFINEQVTIETIKSAKDFLKDSKPDDVFVLFIAGHGMHDHDAEATYYYLTHNTDLKNLKVTAADFETIEDLLQGIPPRNKLFLMDACESGELDDETYENLQGFQNLEGLGIASRGFKKVPDEALEAGTSTVSTSSTSAVPGKRTYLYQKDRYIYNDLVRRSGAIVFSSSKGGELSYERSDIENGLFTEYIMKALTTTEADRDKNGTVSTDELRQYVSEQVAKASGDLQHPTVDRDNIYQKFGFQVR